MGAPTFVFIAAGVISILVLFFLIWTAYRAFLRYKQWRLEQRRVTLFEDIRSIKIVRWNDDVACNDNCTLCMETFNCGEDVAMLPCDHGFHFRCIEEQILRARLTCPYCTAEIVPNSHIYREGDFLDEPDQDSEGVPLLRQTLLQRLKGGNIRRLSVPSDLEQDPGTTSPRAGPSRSRAMAIGGAAGASQSLQVTLRRSDPSLAAATATTI